MKLLIAFSLCFSSIAYAAEENTCSSLTSFIHAASTGWLWQKPNTQFALATMDACMPTSAAPNGALCIKKEATLEKARHTASIWLKEINTCLNAKTSAASLKTIAIGNVSHEVLEFEPLIYRGLPFKMNLRIQENAQGGGVVTWFVAPQPTKDAPADVNICPMIAELLNPEELRNDWPRWQGPIVEKEENSVQYICAKVPHQAASRYDCSLGIGAETSILTTRWVYPFSQSTQVALFANAMAQKIAACDVGLEWKKGATRHQIDNPQKQVRIGIVSNQNDTGRGPSVTMQVQHWKR